MNNEVNYDANIFYLAAIIKNIQKGATLKIDPSFFLDKLVEDIMFSDKALKIIMEQISRHKPIVNTEQHFRNLYLTKRDLVILLEDICAGTLSFSKHLKQYKQRFLQIILSQKSDLAEIDTILNFDEYQYDKKNIVSSEEYKILLDNTE